MEKLEINQFYKSFIPRDKPKSLVIFILSLLTGLLIAVPLAIISILIKIKILAYASKYLLIFCGTVCLIMWIIFFFKGLNGEYKNVDSKPWKDQLF